MAQKRKYPVGIQSFEKLRKDGYVYVDKTHLIYKMITEGAPYFLSRPRRFGKSLLVSTLAAVFEGRRDLFESFTTENGIEQPQLFIATTDWKWEPHPVLRFDFSTGEYTNLERHDNYINSTLAAYEEKFGIQSTLTDSNMRLTQIILTAEKQTGHRVVVLCDEYDSAMLHSIGDAEKQLAIRERFQNLFAPLKELDQHLQFVFITGISKFSQMGVFSRLNQLMNISMLADYEEICGISDKELTTVLRPDIEQMAQRIGSTYDDTVAELKKTYDGYHFGNRMVDIYNPFSVIYALYSCEIKNYWFSSATPSALISMLAQMPPIEMSDVDGVRCDEAMFDISFDNYDNPLPALFQSGYITIKDYDPEYNEYTLGFPNEEVRKGFANCLYQHITQTQANDSTRSMLLRAFNLFQRTEDLPAFIEALKAFFASVPYVIAGKNEHYYHSMLYTLLTAFGADVVAEEMSAKGRADIVLRTKQRIYIFETKYGNHTADEALRQIDECGYAGKYAINGRPVTKVGMVFGSSERNITDWNYSEKP